jgi:hypothetical protein
MKDIATRGRSSTLFFLIILWCSPSLAYADETDAIIDKALKSSGIAGQMEMLVESVVSLMPADVLPEGRLKTRVTASVRKATDGKAALATLRASVKENFDPDKIQQVVSFYNTKVGQKAGRLLRSALEAESLRQARQGRATLSATDEARLALFKRIIRAENVVEITVRLADAIMRGLIEGSSESSGSGKNLAPEGLKPPEIRTGAWENHIEDLAMLSFAVTLRPLDNRELEELAAFCESDAGGWFRVSVQKGMEKATYQTARALAAAVTEQGRAASPAN